MPGKQTAIVTGASGGIGAGLVERFLAEGYNVVATSRNASQKLTASVSLVLVDGDISMQQTAGQVVEAAISNFGTIDVLVNNAGIFLTRPFLDFTTEDFDALVSTNLRGFLLMTQRTVKEMLRRKSGCVMSITAALADRPIAGETASVSMMTKGGLNAITRNLAVEYASDGIRFNAVAPGVTDTPMHRNEPGGAKPQPVVKKATVEDIVDAVLYLVRAGHINGEILHVDGAAPAPSMVEGLRVQARRRLSGWNRTGDVWHVWVRGITAGQLHGYRIEGPYKPEEGQRFNPHKLLLDPCATAIAGVRDCDLSAARGYDSSSRLLVARLVITRRASFHNIPEHSCCLRLLSSCGTVHHRGGELRGVALTQLRARMK